MTLVRADVELRNKDILDSTPGFHQHDFPNHGNGANGMVTKEGINLNNNSKFCSWMLVKRSLRKKGPGTQSNLNYEKGSMSNNGQTSQGSSFDALEMEERMDEQNKHEENAEDMGNKEKDQLKIFSCEKGYPTRAARR
ncbi:hypothetical protein RIF29_03431 [Crotalaria pallida]|uniref:Uncharacterized protein n=1 Tax=Crotalaria pallida TaxID=3830 RepID=A0AAN9J0T3_CROPI